ncbi:MAG: hypothetical protein ACI4BD_06945 [Paludibacteraceae bacterium]
MKKDKFHIGTHTRTNYGSIVFVIGLLLIASTQNTFGYDSTDYVEVTATASFPPTGAGLVYISKGNPVDGTPKWESSATNKASCGGSSGNAVHDGGQIFYFYAEQPGETDNEYKFDAWYENGGRLDDSYSYEYKRALVAESHTSNNSAQSTTTTATYTYVAKWVQPRLENGEDGTMNLGTVISPTDNELSKDIACNVLDVISETDIEATFPSEEHNFAVGSGTLNSEKTTQTWSVTYTPTGVHGTHSSILTICSKYGTSSTEYKQKKYTVSVTEDYTPTFNLANLAFGNVKSSESSTLSVSPTSTVYASNNGTWSAEIGGTDTDNFRLNSVGTDGECSVTFDPKSKDGAYKATLTLTCTYEDALGAEITHSQTIALTGTGYTPKETLLSLKNTAENTGEFVDSDPLFGGSTYRYPDQLGTAVKTAQFNVSYQYLSDPTFKWTDNDDDVFSLEQGDPAFGENGITYIMPITIKAGVSTAVATSTTYQATLTISGTSTLDATTFTQTLLVSVTISPKKANTLKWGLEKTSSYYVLYTDQANQPAFKDRNSPAPITISSSYTSFASYVTIDNDLYTLSPISGKTMTSSRNIHAEQAESDEYEGIVLDTVMQVRKHNLAFTYPQVDPTRGNGTRLYRNTRYDKILSTNSIDAGETTGFLEFKYFDDTDDGKYGQTLIDNGDGTYGMQTGDLITPSPYLRFVANIPPTTNYYGRENTTNSAVSFLIIKDPIHVPTGPGSLSMFTSGAHIGEYYGLWLNNAYDMYGSTFRVSDYKATWIGYDWVKNASGVYEWTGTNTGRTDWAVDSNGKTAGSTNAFALENGGSVVFRFRGVPMYTYFAMYFQTATSDGTVTVEESADGSTWTACTNNSTSATYLSAPGGKGVWMKGNSRYIRFSYSGNNYVVITGTNIYEHTNIITSFSKNYTTTADTIPSNKNHKEHIDADYHELRKNSDGTWGIFDFTLKVANWGKNGIQYTIDNPDFELVIDDEGYLAANTGLDEYKEFPAQVKYSGSKLTDRATIKLFTRDFYSKTSTDTLRSLTFAVNAMDFNTNMPLTITNATKTTTYLTGTVVPFPNTIDDITKKDLRNTMYSATHGDNPHIGLNKQDFSSCFGSDGVPLFDELYIFGVTTNDDNATQKHTYSYYDAEGMQKSTTGTFPYIRKPGTNIVSNAVTPCYVYKKTSDGTGYELTSTIDNMNTPDKPIGTFTSSGKYYFSGHCPCGSTGYTQTSDGILHFKGNSSTNVDIYLENCWLISRGKNQDGSVPGESDAQKVNTGNNVMGSGAVIVLQSTSASESKQFAPNIHVKGDNYLRSNTGVYIKVVTILGTMTANQYSSPIHIYTPEKTEYTKLTIDDIWPISSGSTEHCNGRLVLHPLSNSCPSIDIGNEYSTVIFNGGRINLMNGYPNSSNYTTTEAISWRKKTVFSASVYGMGDDTDGGTIRFSDGSISAFPITLTEKYSSYYRDNISLKCPSGTTIDGGTFDCSIWACPTPTDLGESPKNSAETPAALTKYEAKAKLPYKDNGLVEIDFPYDLTNNKEGDANYGQTLEEYYKSVGLTYNISSICANDTGYVVLMLPADYTGGKVFDNATVNQWAFVSTSMVANGGIKKVEIGGDATVLSDNSNTTSRLLWSQIDSYTRDAGNDDNYKTPVYSQTDVSVALEISDEAYGNVLNTEEYTIEKKLYVLIAVQADIWTSFMAPFDISNIYVFDTYAYHELKKMGRSEALKKQGTENVNLAYFIGNNIQGMGDGKNDLSSYVDIFLHYGYGQDTTSGVYPKDANTDKNGLPYYPTKYTDAKGYTTDYRGQNKIIPYDGTNINTAHFFLYHSANKQWGFDGTNFTTDWELVTPVNKTIGEEERSVLMQQGEIYAMQFPYCPGCDNVAERDYFDYWTGKFILLEGYGPQVLHGKDAQSEQFSSYTVANSGTLRGNITLAEMQVPNYSGASGQLDNAFFQTDGKNVFEPAQDKASGLLAPTGVFLLANPGTRSAARIATVNVRSGVVTYDTDDTPTGVPTLSKGHTLLVGSDHQGLYITAIESQQVMVYSAAGQLVASQWLSGEWYLPVPQGLYMVTGSQDKAKAIVQ